MLAVSHARHSGPTAGSDRKSTALAHWRRRSRLVHFYRRALPAAIVLLILLVAGWIAIGDLIASLSAPTEKVGSIHLLHPRFYGRNDKGEAYVISATEAIRDASDIDRIALSAPSLVLDNGQGQPTTLKADTGVYHDKERLLDLQGHVVLNDGRGNELHSQTAHVDNQTGVATGQSAVEGQGPMGHIAADSYAIYDKGDRVVFTGHVRTHLNNDQTPAGAPR